MSDPLATLSDLLRPVFADLARENDVGLFNETRGDNVAAGPHLAGIQRMLKGYGVAVPR